MRSITLVRFALAVAVLLWSGLVSAQVQPVDCQTELIACTHNGEVVAVNINDGSARLLSTYIFGGGGGGASGDQQQPVSTFGTEIEYDFNTGNVWLESTDGGIEIIEIDILTGAVETITTHGPFSLAGMEYIGTTLYSSVIALGAGGGGGTGGGIDQGDATFAIFDTTTGVATPIGDMGTGSPINGLAIHPTSGVLYGITSGGLPATLVTVNVGTGLATPVGATGYVRIGSIEFGPDGNLYGATTSTGTPDANSLVTIDTGTGVATLVGQTGYSITGLAACEVVPVELMKFTVD